MEKQTEEITRMHFTFFNIPYNHDIFLSQHCLMVVLLRYGVECLMEDLVAKCVRLCVG